MKVRVSCCEISAGPQWSMDNGSAPNTQERKHRYLILITTRCSKKKYIHVTYEDVEKTIIPSSYTEKVKDLGKINVSPCKPSSSVLRQLIVWGIHFLLSHL